MGEVSKGTVGKTQWTSWNSLDGPPFGIGAYVFRCVLPGRRLQHSLFGNENQLLGGVLSPHMELDLTFGGACWFARGTPLAARCFAPAAPEVGTGVEMVSAVACAHLLMTSGCLVLWFRRAPPEKAPTPHNGGGSQDTQSVHSESGGFASE